MPVHANAPEHLPGNWNVAATWGDDALPYEQRRNEDVEQITDIFAIGGNVRAMLEDGASQVVVTAADG